MKCCVKPLRYSICLVACLTVSGCNNTTTSFLSPKQWPLLHLVQLLSQNIIKVDSSPFLVNQHAALETVPAGSLNSTLIEQPFKHEYAFAVQLASVQSKPLLAYSVKKMTKTAAGNLEDKLEARKAEKVKSDRELKWQQRQEKFFGFI